MQPRKVSLEHSIHYLSSNVHVLNNIISTFLLHPPSSNDVLPDVQKKQETKKTQNKIKEIKILAQSNKN